MRLLPFPRVHVDDKQHTLTVTTAIFATCQVGFLTFLAAAILSLPKQFALVYVGVAYDESGSGEASKKSKVVSIAIVVITSVITYLAVRYIRNEMAPLKEDVVYKRRKAR